MSNFLAKLQAAASVDPNATPRTDKEEADEACNFDVPWSEFARTLERELTAVRKQLAVAVEAMIFECDECVDPLAREQMRMALITIEALEEEQP